MQVNGPNRISLSTKFLNPDTLSLVSIWSPFSFFVCNHILMSP